MTEFTFSRWLVPWLCDYQGHAVFMDSDVAVTGDIVELFESCEGWDGREVFVNQKQPEFEWPSVMVFNNALCKVLTPEFVQDESNACYGFQWAKSVGHFPEEWNHCVNVEAPNIDAKLYHYTQGIPYWPEVRGAQEDTFWWQEWELVKQSAPWLDIHGNSVHFKPVIRRMMARYGLDARVN